MEIRYGLFSEQLQKYYYIKETALPYTDDMDHFCVSAIEDAKHYKDKTHVLSLLRRCSIHNPEAEIVVHVLNFKVTYNISITHSLPADLFNMYTHDLYGDHMDSEKLKDVINLVSDVDKLSSEATERLSEAKWKEYKKYKRLLKENGLYEKEV